MCAINIEYLKKQKYINKKTLSFSIVYSKYGNEYEKNLKKKNQLKRFLVQLIM